MDEVQALTGLQAATAAYALADPAELSGLAAPEGYAVLAGLVDDQTGFKAVVYQRSDALTGVSELVVAFAGTEDATDALADLSLGWNQWSSGIAEVFNAIRSETYSSIHFTGHSLGGALAQYAAYSYGMDRSLSTGHAITLSSFNGLGGIAGLTKNVDDFFETPQPTLDAAHFIVDGDLVARLGDGHLGGNTYLLSNTLGTLDGQVSDPFGLPLDSSQPFNFLAAHGTGTLNALVAASGFQGMQAHDPEYLSIGRVGSLAYGIATATNDAGQELDPEEAILRLSGGLAGALLRLADSAADDPAVAEFDALLGALSDNVRAAVDGAEIPAGLGTLALLLDHVDWRTVVNLPLIRDGLESTAVESLLTSVFHDAFDLGTQTLSASGAAALADIMLDYAATHGVELAEVGEALHVHLQTRFLSGSHFNLAALAGHEPDADGNSGAYLIEPEADPLLDFSAIMQVGGRMPIGHPSVAYRELHGDAGDDLLLGVGGLREILHGYSGADFLFGGNGSDLLLGGSGDDALFGGSGDDALRGGDGDDRLQPGAGNDRLFDRSGNDAYHLASSDGHAWLVDLDGRGTLWLDGQLLAGGLPLSASPGEYSDGVHRYRLDGTTLLIDERVSVHDWHNGALGITLELPEYLPDQRLSASDDAGSTLSGGDGNDEIHGAGGDDTLYGGLGDDRLYGGGGDDWLRATPGDDLLDGGDGNDVLISGIDHDRLAGGQGIDFLSAGPGNDRLDGGGDDDVLAAGAGDDVLHGGDGADRLYGDGTFEPTRRDWGVSETLNDDGSVVEVQFTHTAGAQESSADGIDLLHGGLGDDDLLGGGGDDLLFGDEGNDYLDGGHGSDQLEGGAGHDRLHGHAALPGERELDGADILDGGDGDDWLSGGYGDDLLRGGAGADELHGDYLDDPLLGGDDFLDGGDGDDLLLAGPGNDELHGGAGHDSADGGAGDDRFFGGSGNDQAGGGAGNDRLFGEEDDDLLLGGDGDDLLVGGPGVDRLYGEAGHDELRGGAGDDTLVGAAGDDLLDGGAGHDTLFGDDGHDTLRGGLGDDSLVAAAGDDLLDGGDGADTLWGEAGNDTLHGGPGDDRLVGGGDDDLLAGDGGNDTLWGELGSDALHGGAGDDVLLGGPGDDLYHFAAGDGRDRIAEEPDSSGDRLRFAAGIAPGKVEIGRNSQDLVLQLAGSDDRVTVSGWFNDRRLELAAIEFADGSAWDGSYLYAQAQTLWLGGDGNDTLYGSALADRLFGHAGDDRLYGSGGDDLLVGGPGDDLLHGGSGADRYLYARGDGHDRVTLSGVVEDTLAFASDVEPGSLAIERSDDDLVLRTRDGSGSVTVADWYRDGGYLRLQRVDFAADGSSLAAAELTRLGTEIDHHYALAPGSGTRAVTDWGGSDTLTLGPGVEPAEVTFSRPGNALRVELASGDALTFQEWFQDRARQVETIVFSDGGQPLDPAQVTASLLTVTGTAAADSLLGGDAYADTLLGLDGNDTLQGGAGDDTLDGGPGDDWIYPGSGNDVVRGGPGDDRINDSDGSDSYHLARGDGWDTIIDSKGSNRLVIAADLPYTLARTSVENGDYLIRFEGLADGVRVVDAPSLNNISTSFRYLFTQDGTPGDDTLTGYGIGNLLNGFDGDDTLLGGGSRDELYGGAGNDLLDGGHESDFYYGGPGDDTLGGAFGSDDFVSASNYYQGGPGNDLLRGTIKADSYFFAPGDGHDTIVEEPYVYYSSVLYSSNDGLRLGAGLTPEDLVVRRSGSDLVLDFGAGDSVTVARWFDSYTRQVDWVRFADGSQLDSAALTALSYIQHGGAGDDTLLGYGGAADTLYGHGGNDTLRGYGGNDLLDGGPGDDLLDGGSGNDRYLVAAGDGHDTLLEAGGSDSVLFAAGIARDAVVIGRADNDLLLGLGSDSSLRVPGFLNQSQRWIERFEFADGSLLPEPATLAAQLVTQNGGALDDLLQGCDGIDVLLGDGGDDTLLGLADADRLEGGSGDDLLAGGPGADLLLGGPGNDRYLLQQGDGLDRLLDADGQGRLEFGPGIGLAALTAQVVWTAAGHRLELGYGSGDRVDIDSALDQPAFAFALDGAAPATLPALLAELAGRDGFLAHSVEGGAFPGGTVAAVHGTALPDHLLGSAGSDNLHGGAGDDWLEGASGQDRLAGGPGDDLLHGGSGVDTYLFGAGDGHDRVQEGSLYEASTVEFTGGVALADVLIQPRAGNLEFQLQPGGETLTYLDWKQGKNSAQLSARFADGSRLEPSQLAGSALLGSDGNDTLRGGRGGERLYGGFGDDRLLGRAGADLLYGGPGDDLLDGGQDGDTYLFSAGWGHDTLAESAGYSGLDEVAFGSGLGPLDLVYARDGSDLLVTRLGGGDSLRLSGWYGSGGPSVEQFRASDGALLGQAAVQGLVDAIASFDAETRGGWNTLVEQRPDEAQALLATYWEPAAATAG